MTDEKLDLIQVDLSRLGAIWKLDRNLPVPKVAGEIGIEYGGVVYNSYALDIFLVEPYPEKVPVIYEASKKIPRTPERHINGDGDICLFVPDERWSQWPMGASFYDLIMGPVRNYFIGQVVYENEKRWPFGERPHNFDGVVDYYERFLSVSGRPKVLGLLEFAARGKLKLSWTCPCGSDLSLGTCHLQKLLTLRENIPSKRIKKVCEKLRNGN